MRRFGSFLMIAGASLVAAAIAGAFYLASLACVMMTTGCTQDPVSLFFELMFSRDSLMFWFVIVAGLIAFQHGYKMRAAHPTVINKKGE